MPHGLYITELGVIDGESTVNGYSGEAVALSADGKVVAIGAPGNDDGGTDAGHVRIYEYINGVWTPKGADLDGVANDERGYSVSISDDGNTVALSSTNTSSISVYGWDNGNNAWVLLGKEFLGFDGEGIYGPSVSLSGDGTRIAIGSPGFDTRDIANSGKVEVYEWNPNAGLGTGSWSRLGASIFGSGVADLAGLNVSLSNDGNTLVVPEPFYDVVDGPGDAGLVRVFQLTNYSSGTTDSSPTGTWVEKGFSIPGLTLNEKSGFSTAISSDGNILAVGASGYDDTNNGDDVGVVRIYEYSEGSWIPKGSPIKGESVNEQSGQSLTLSGDGRTLAIGSPNASSFSGLVRVFSYDEEYGEWIPAYSETVLSGESGDQLGFSLSLSDDGTTLAVGAPHDDDGGGDAGQVRLYSISSDGGSLSGDGYTPGDDGSSTPDTTPPTFIDGPSVFINDILENSADGTIIHTASINESEAVTYSLDGVDKDLFSIHPGTGVVTVNGLLDYESPNDGAYSFKVLAEDASNNIAIQEVALNVADQIIYSPSLDDIKDTDGFIDTNTPTLSGIAPSGSTIKIYDNNNNEISQPYVVSGGSSSWSVTTNQLSDGNQSLYYTYTPVGGRESDKSAILSGFKIDQTAPLLHNSPGTKMPDQSLTSMTVGTADTILVQLNISDPGDSGVAGIRAFFKSPTGSQEKEIIFDVVSDRVSPTFNQWQKAFKLDQPGVEGGTWYLDRLILTDNQGNVNTQTVDRTSESYLKDIEFQVNNLPSGKPVFNGPKKLGQTLKIDESTIFDPENSGSSGINYEYKWLVSDSGAEGSWSILSDFSSTQDSYQLTEADANKYFKSVVKYTDGQGFDEIVEGDHFKFTEFDVSKGPLTQTFESDNGGWTFKDGSIIELKDERTDNNYLGFLDNSNDHDSAKGGIKKTFNLEGNAYKIGLDFLKFNSWDTQDWFSVQIDDQVLFTYKPNSTNNGDHIPAYVSKPGEGAGFRWTLNKSYEGMLNDGLSTFLEGRRYAIEIELPNPLKNFDLKVNYNIDQTHSDEWGGIDNVKIYQEIPISGSVAAPIFSSPETATTVEKAGQGNIVYEAAADDQSPFTYALEGTDHNLFSIDANTGAVKMLEDANYANRSSYNFTVNATDVFGNSSSRNVQLAVEDSSLAFWKDGIYRIDSVDRSGPTPSITATSLKDQRNRLLSDSTDRSWNGVSVIKSNDGYRMLQIGERGITRGKYRIAELNSAGVLQNVGRFLSVSDAVAKGYEELFEVHLNNDGHIGIPAATDNDHDGFVDGLGHYRLIGTTKDVDFKGRRGTLLSARSSRHWDALMSKAKGDGSGFDVLIQGTRGRNSGKYQVWSTDTSGTVTSNSRWMNLQTLVNEGYEATFNQDLDGVDGVKKKQVITPTQGTVNKSMYLAPHALWQKADGISIPANSSLDLTGEVTIAFWLNRDASDTYQSLQGIYQVYGLGIRGGKLEWSRSTSGSSSTDQFSVESSTIIPVNQWTHISAVMRNMGDGTYKAELWVNGQLNAFTSSTEGIQNTLNDLSILPAGKFDNIQVWNTALSQSEIPLVANNQGFDISRDSLIAEYTFEKDTGGTNTNAFDSSGKENHGLLIGENGGTIIVQEVSDPGPLRVFPDTNSDGFVDGMGHYMLKGLAPNHAVDFKGRRGTVLSARSSRSWDALRSEAKGDGTGFDVLIQGIRGRNNGKYQVWSTDTSGTVTSNSRWMNLDTLVNEGYEATFNKDLDGKDGLKASPLASGPLDMNSDGLVDGITNYTLFKSAVSPSPAQAIGLIDRRGRNLSDQSSRQWNVIKAVETLDGDFKVLIQGERGIRRSQYQVWTADNAGLITNQSRWLSSDQLAGDGYDILFDVAFGADGSATI